MPASNLLQRAREYALHQLALVAERAGVAGGPSVGLLTPVKYRQQETHPLIGADVETLHSAILASFRGNPARLQDLYDDIEDRDPRVAAVCATRVLVIQSRQWKVEPPESLREDKAAQQRAEKVRELLGKVRTPEGGGWRAVVGAAASGILRGYAVQELEWNISADGYHYPHTAHWRHPNRFGWDAQNEFVFRDRPGVVSGGTRLPELGRDRFLVHAPTAGRTAYPPRRGVMLGMLFPSLAKRSDLRWWLKGTERWGAPMVLGELPAGSQASRDEAKQLLRRLSQDFVGVVWGGIKVTPIAGSGTLRPEVYSQLYDACNTEIAIRGLGQNLTTEIQGGSYAAANIQNLVRLDVLGGDLAELDGTIQSQVIEPLCRYNWPRALPSVYSTSIDSRAEIMIADVQAGYFDEAEYRGSKGYTPKVVEEDATIDVKQTLNGAQVQSLQAIVIATATGQLPRDAAVKMIQLAFQLTPQDAEDVLGSAGTDAFTPTVVDASGVPVEAVYGGGAPDVVSPFPRSGSRALISPTSVRWTTPRASELARRLAE